ncbi:MAG: NAD(P)H-dependent oxidoreductase, partial [Actinomycetota bacterium]
MSEGKEHQMRNCVDESHIPIRLLGISGSLRESSFNRRLLLTAAELLDPPFKLHVFSGLKAVEPFDEDDEAVPPPGATAMRQAIRAARGVVIATPEYNSSLPGQLKNALDWASRPRETSVLIGKPMLVIGASPSRFGAAWAQDEARKVLKRSGADVLEMGFALGNAFAEFDESNMLRSEAYRDQLRGLLLTFVEHIRPQESIFAG